MSKLNLNIKLKHIRALEKGGKPFIDTLQQGPMGVCDFLNACDKSDDEIEEMLKKYGIEELTLLVVEELQEAGFLPKTDKSIREMLKGEPTEQSPKLS